jgi:peptidoglycan hydrolase CwlO-like protein
MKKYIVIALSIAAIMISFTSCSKKDTDTSTTAGDDTTYNITEDNALEQADKILKDLDSL